MAKTKIKNIDGARFYTIEKTSYISVTTTCKMLPKPFLMPWYANMEKKAVRRLLKKYKKKHLLLTALLEELAKLAKKKSPTAASIYIEKTSKFGNALHAAIEGFFTGHKPKLQGKQKKCFKQFKTWWKTSGFTAIKKESEFVVHSKKLKVAGTVDQGVLREKRHEILDWKTGKSVYPDHYFQVVIYIICCQEMGLKVKRGWIVHTPRDGSKVKVYKVIPGKGQAPSFEQVKQMIAFWKMLNPKRS